MDDLGSELYPADMIINYNAYSDEIPYGRMYGGSGTKLLLGPAYAPLREGFRSVRIKPVADKIGDIMITTGSTDPCNVSGSLAKRLSQDSDFEGIHLHIVVGRYYENDSALKEIPRICPQVAVHENISYMPELMTRCDAAVLCRRYDRL